MKVYIAGPMTKYRDQNYNFPAFYKAQGLLEMAGHEVVNPARMDIDDGHVQYSLFERRLVQAPGFSLHDAMRRDVSAIATCDAVVLLPGWEDSVGAANEVHVARDIFGLPIYELSITAESWPVLTEVSDEKL